MGQNYHIIDFSQIYKLDEDLVGKKAHELGALWELGIPLPKGFVITTNFFKEFLRMIDINKKIYKSPSLKHPALSDSTDKLFQKKIIQSHIPQVLVSELHNYYKSLSGLFKNRPLNIFSSSSDNKSITFTNIKGDANLILKIKTIWSLSLEKPVAIAVQENIISEIKGKIVTDGPTIDKNLTQKQMSKLIDYCKIIQKHFYFPYELEYAVKKNKIFITKINPFTGSAIEPSKPLIQDNKTQKIIIKGISINPGIVTGRVGIRKGDIAVLPKLDSSIFKKIKYAKAVIINSVLQNSLNKALFRKNFQIPAVEGVKDATRMFHNGNIITVNGVSGEIYSGGLVY